MLPRGIQKKWYQGMVPSFHGLTTASERAAEPLTLQGITYGSLQALGEGLDTGTQTKIWHIVTVRNHGAYHSHWTLKLKATSR